MVFFLTTRVSTSSCYQGTSLAGMVISLQFIIILNCTTSLSSIQLDKNIFKKIRPAFPRPRVN